MTHLDAADLKNGAQYELLVDLGHKDLAPFVTHYYLRQRSVVTWTHYLLSLALLVLWFAARSRGQYSSGEWRAAVGYAAVGFVALFPVHELLHAAIYWLAGARDLRFGVSLRGLYVYAIAHNFVANRRVFTWAALSPFIVINTLLVLAIVALPGARLVLLGVLLMHTAGSSGDWAFLNYCWLHRGRDLYTLDDAVEERTYVYALRQQQ
jgi:hypothetical protein